MPYLVTFGNKKRYECRDIDDFSKVIYAHPRKSLIYQLGPVFIGDEVEIDGENTIVFRKERKNLLIRPKIANLDLAIVVCSSRQPDFSSYLLDKFITYLNKCGVNSSIVFTKIDMLDDNELKTIQAYASYYQKIGYKTYLTSSLNPDSYALLKKDIEFKKCAFSGQTGAGKSTLINSLDPSFNRDIGEYSKALGRGKHQTKEVVLLPFQGGYIGDTPGFSSLDLNLIGLKKRDVYQYFPGFERYLGKCFFNDCTHINERDCEVKKAVDNGEISLEAYQNYLKLVDEVIS